MAHAQAENWAIGAQSTFGHVCKLTQVMKSAGWTHLASSDGAAVSTDPATDKWAGAVWEVWTSRGSPSLTPPSGHTLVGTTVEAMRQ
jgi:hypothetical protein